MKLLLHICCAPCAIYPVRILRDEGHEVMGFFYRHNIHPFTECRKREETLKEYADQIGLKVIYSKDYDMETFIRNVVYREANRCTYCYFDRLNQTAHLAGRGKFDAFSTTLFYSKYQNHETIRKLGESIQKTVGVGFYYRDFREGWKEGIETSRKLQMYRQQYCGCIYSEKERYLGIIKPA